ncbi:MAG: TatD family hydrolase [Bacteroidales bacterium]|jgi:TatD DNase family protein|nr:TatD family hydrolase [Bacteroidales bacterium]
MFIDSHTHLYFDDYQNDIEDVMARCLKNNVQKCVIAGVSNETIVPIIELCKQFPNICYPCIGLHPTDVKENYLEELKIIEDELQKRKYYAVGETGLDYFWDKTFEKEQKDAFVQQILLAQKYNLPLIIHSRDAFEDTVDILEPRVKSQKPRQGVFHCFSGTVEQAKKVVEMGFYIGIGGVVTFKKNQLVDVVKEIDLQYILLETDAPFLAPVPYRGQRNESSYIPIIAQKVAEIKGICIEEVTKITTSNSENCFKF